MLGPDQTWALWAVLLVGAAVGLYSERTRWGGRVSGAVVSMGFTFALSNLGLIPAAAPAYDVVWSYFVPLAIPLLLFRADLRRILREAGPTLLAFGAGAVGTVAGTLIAYRLVPLGPEGWKLAGVFCATYVGGSMNYVAAAEALDLRSADLLTAGMAADNLVMTLYFLVLFALPAVGWLRRRLPERAAPGEPPPAVEAEAARTITVTSLTGALAVAAVVAAVGFGIEAALGWPGAGILSITAVMVVLATAFPRALDRLTGSAEVGTVLMQVFFATIGASANVAVVLKVGSVLFVFAAVILTVHLAFLLTAGWLLKLDLREVVIASNANMGGPTTAAAMAAARRWDALVIPAILCGTLGYAIATFVGVAVGRWLG